jgi:2-keto-4-pentenoate hydratase/2-oxohepta-3-ene-1,7-dioic acid hydratase in catechol pathway
MKLVDLSIPLEGGQNRQLPQIKVHHQGHKASCWLKPGDVVELEVAGLGILQNRIVKQK